MVYVFNSTEENLLDYTLPEGVETFQVRAKLFYSDGSPVVDMNGNEVTHVVSDVIRGTAPSVSASGDQAADSLTVGDTASVTIDSTTGTPTPNVNYLWKVDDVSQINSTNTFDTTGLSGGEVLTCTVTASNGVSPDATANVNFGTVAALSDWDTYASDGRWRSSFAGGSAPTQLASETFFTGTAPTSTERGSAGNYDFAIGPNFFYGAPITGGPPFAGVWDGVQWNVGAANGITAGRRKYGDGTNIVSGNNYYFVLFKQDPGDPVGWRAYDGPA